MKSSYYTGTFDALLKNKIHLEIVETPGKLQYDHSDLSEESLIRRYVIFRSSQYDTINFLEAADRCLLNNYGSNILSQYALEEIIFNLSA